MSVTSRLPADSTLAVRYLRGKLGTFRFKNSSKKAYAALQRTKSGSADDRLLWVKTGKAQPEQMSSALGREADVPSIT
jgi:hypothetical protein